MRTLYACACTYVCMCMHKCITWAYVYLCKDIEVCACIYVCTYVCAHVYAYAFGGYIA